MQKSPVSVALKVLSHEGGAGGLHPQKGRALNSVSPGCAGIEWASAVPCKHRSSQPVAFPEPPPWPRAEEIAPAFFSVEDLGPLFKNREGSAHRYGFLELALPGTGRGPPGAGRPLAWDWLFCPRSAFLAWGGLPSLDSPTVCPPGPSQAPGPIAPSDSTGRPKDWT